MNSEKRKLRDYQDVDIVYKSSSKFLGAGGMFPLPDFNEKIKEFSIKQGKIIIKGERVTLCFINAPTEVIKKLEIKIHDYIGRPIKSIEEIEI